MKDHELPHPIHCDNCANVRAEIASAGFLGAPDDATSINAMAGTIRDLRAEASRLQMLARTYVRTEGTDIEPGRALVVQAEYIGKLRGAITEYRNELNASPSWEQDTSDVVDRLSAMLSTSPPQQARVLTDDECAALTRAMGALDDPARHSAVEYGRAWVNCVTAALQQTHSKVTATTEKDAQGVDFGAAAQTRTGNLLITNQGGDCSETPQNQEDRQEPAPAATAESVRSGSSTYDPVTATPAALKDHEIAQLVNELTAAARAYSTTQQLRERIAALVVPALRGLALA